MDFKVGDRIKIAQYESYYGVCVIVKISFNSYFLDNRADKTAKSELNGTQYSSMPSTFIKQSRAIKLNTKKDYK